MLKEKLSPIRRDVPEKGRASRLRVSHLDGKVSMAEIAFFRQVFGKEGLKFFVEVARMSDPTHKCHKELLEKYGNYEHFFESQEADGVFERIESHFFAWVRRSFHIEEGKEAIYVNRMIDLSRMVQQEIIQELFYPEYQMVMSLKNQVQALSCFPHLWIEYMSSVSAAVSAHETLRTLIIAMICAELDWRTHTHRHNAILTKFQRFMDTKIFSGPYGETKPISIFSKHDADDNRVLAWGTQEADLQPFFERKHIKQQLVTARTVVADDGRTWSIVTNTRKKSLTSSVLKALERAVQDESTTVRTLEDVQDMLGMQFIVIGDEASSASFIDYIEKTLKQKQMKQQLGICNITRKDTVTGKRGSEHFKFYRLKIEVMDQGDCVAPTEMEIIVKPVQWWLDGELHVGKIMIGNDNFPKCDGASHEIKEWLRIGNPCLLEMLFPERIYKQNGIGKSPSFFVTQKLVAKIAELKRRYSTEF